MQTAVHFMRIRIQRIQNNLQAQSVTIFETTLYLRVTKPPQNMEKDRMPASLFSLIKYRTVRKKADNLFKEYKFVQILCTVVRLYATIVWVLECTVDNITMA